MLGLITEEIGEHLERFASEVPAEHAIVEIGAFKGMSTTYLARGSKAGGSHVWSIDPWDLQPRPGKHGYNNPQVRVEYEQNLRAARVWSRVTPIRGYSIQVAKTWDGPPVGLLFIDGDHEYNSVRDDFTAWFGHFADTTTVLFDDYNTPRNPGVKRFVDELVGKPKVYAERLAMARFRADD